MKKFHVCIITSGRILENTIGGEEIFAKNLARWLAGNGYLVTLLGSGLLVPKEKRFDSSCLKIDDGYRKDQNRKTDNRSVTRYVPYFVYWLSRLVMCLFWIIKLGWIHFRVPISIIHAQDTGYSGLAAVLTALFFRIPVIITSHGVRHKTLETRIRGRFANILLKIEYNIDRFTLRKATRVIAVNPVVKQYFEAEGFRKSVDFIPIGIDLDKFKFSKANRCKIREEFGIDEKSIVLGFTGRLVPVKNVMTLLNAFYKVVNSSSNIKLLIVGIGPMKEELEKFTSQKLIGDIVVFCGLRHDVEKMLSAFDIFVLPSFLEGLPTSLIEAMATARAIICSDIPTNRELIQHDVNGLLADPNNVHEFEQEINLLCTDRQKRERLGWNACLTSRSYNQECIFLKISKYYTEVLEPARKYAV